MIRRLYIDGYKAFVNHTIEFDRLVFLAGGNGTGKSGHFDVLWALRQVVFEGKAPGVAFPAPTFTQFKRRGNEFDGIVVEATLDLPDGLCRYRPVLGKNEEAEVSIVKEHLVIGGEPLYVYRDGNVSAFAKDGKMMAAPLEPNRSALSLFSWSNINPKVASFTYGLANVLNVRLNPFSISDAPISVVPFLDRNGENLVRWLAGILSDFRQAQRIVERWTQALGVPVNLHFEASRLVLDLTYGSQVQHASMSDLSEGQRALLVVHALLAVVELRGGTLLIDEPDNFLSIRESQALVSEIQSVVEREDAQILVISHNASLVRSLGGLYGYRFYRDPENGHIRYTDLAEESDGVSADLIVQLEEAV